MNPYLLDRLACPISKEPLIHEDGVYTSSAGIGYDGRDFRVGLEFSDKWKEGQNDYEIAEQKWLSSLDKVSRLEELDEETMDVYESIKMSGDILDVGGAYGFVIKQAQLDPERYIAIDPMDLRWENLLPYKNISSHYEICKNVPRIRGFAEFLPFQRQSFDFIHMRSCLDHFANPKLALLEAFRCLKDEGQLVIGVSLEGAYKRSQHGLRGMVYRMTSYSSLARRCLDTLKGDHHMFHPTRETLYQLIEENGFTVHTEVMQKAFHNVIYLQATKLKTHKYGHNS